VAQILIVDDSNFTRFTTKKILEQLGHQVIEAEDGAACIESLKTNKPQLIISDLMMPNMNGNELVRHLKSNSSDIPLIIVTSDIQDSTHSELLESGAIAVIHKPLNSHIKELSDLISQNTRTTEAS